MSDTSKIKVYIDEGYQDDLDAIGRFLSEFDLIPGIINDKDEVNRSAVVRWLIDAERERLINRDLWESVGGKLRVIGE